MRTLTPTDQSEPNRSKPQDGPLLATNGATYISIWERLPDVLERVMATALSKEDAQTSICRAIADGAIRFRAQLKSHATRHMTSTSMLERTAFEVPAAIKPGDLDWERSHPVKPWVIRRGAYSPPGRWYLAWIELSKTDVTNVLCSAQAAGEPPRCSSGESLATGSSYPRVTGAPHPDATPSVAPENSRVAVAARRRGPPGRKFNATRDAMLKDIREGKLTPTELDRMPEKNLSERYGVSRDTARKARNAALSELTVPNPRQISTNDN